MSAITIFKDSAAKIGNFEADSSAICIVNCDDAYDEKVLYVTGNDELNLIKNKSKKWKFFVEFNDLKMKTLSERMNMKFGVVSDAHLIKNVNLGIAAYDTLCLICSELNIDLTNVADSDFDSASIILKDFCNGANDDTGYTVSVWFN